MYSKSEEEKGSKGRRRKEGRRKSGRNYRKIGKMEERRVGKKGKEDRVRN